jgi:cytochrome P450
MTTADIVIDLTDQEYRLRPWRIYERLREESPVHRMPATSAEGEEFYALSRYDDVAMALRDKKLFSSHVRRGDFLDLAILVNRDAPDHTRLRHVANRAFNARVVRTLGDWVQEIVDTLVDEVLAKDRVEFVEDFTTMLPMRVICGMLGIPLDRKAELRRWSHAVTDLFAVAGGMDPAEVPGFFEDFLQFGNYIESLANQREGCPHRGDVLDDLVARKGAGELTRDELVGLGWSFVAAGHETTMNLLGGGVEMMLRDRDFGHFMVTHPDRTEDFMEEYLRLYSPSQWVLRRTRQEIELHDVVIPAGALLHVLLGAANRDPRKFPDPEKFDLDRENKEEHMAFGGGPHFCPGSSIGRLFVAKAFRALYPHLDRLSLDPADPPRLRTRQGSYGIAHMPVLIRG